MSKARNLNIDHQMFVPNLDTGAEHVSLSLEGQPEAQAQTASSMVDPNPGPSVDVRERSVHLVSALTEFGKISSGIGFRIAAGIDPLRRQLERNVDDVDAVAGRMANAEPSRVTNARISFGRAFGAAAIAGAGAMSIDKVEGGASKSFANFKRVYMGTDENTGGDGHPKRSVFKKNLQKQVTNMNRNPKTKAST